MRRWDGVLEAALAVLLIAGVAHGVDYDVVILGSHARGVAVGDGQQGGFLSLADADGEPYQHAVLWTGSPQSLVDLNPAGCLTSQVWDVSEGRQVGAADGHALLWSDTAQSVIDLHPADVDYSCAYALWGDVQVGVGIVESVGEHALLWSGTAERVLDLHPAGFIGSRAVGVWGGWQVGYGVPSGGDGMDWRALLWSGTAESVVNLHPAGFRRSCASDIWGPWQVGSGRPADGEATHALLWSGTAESIVDLHPSGYAWSYAVRCWGNRQAGMGDDRALLWSGSPENVVNLHRYLPAGCARSGAFGIDATGRIVGYAATHSAEYAVMWVPRQVPLYRCWSPRHGRHLFTQQGAEVEKLILSDPNAWAFERIACHVLPDSRDPNAMPVYQFRSRTNAADFFTIDPSERDKLFRDYREAWTYEGIAFYAYRPDRHPSVATPVYRFWSDTLHCHFYTASEAERDRLTVQHQGIWTCEGVAWYAHP